MSDQPFGNLRDWGAALDELKKRVEAGGLDAIQPGLIRLIRYRDNWKVREEGLRAAARVEHPEAGLVEALLAVAADTETYVDARILAVRALAEIVPRRAPTGLPGDPDPDKVLTVLRELKAVPEAPILHMALEQAMERIAERASPISA